MNRAKHNKTKDFFYNLSPWLLAGACVLLLFVLTLFMVNSYQREKKLVIEALTQKGVTLIRFINSSSRESMRANLRGSQKMLPWEEHVQVAMEQASEQPGVDYVALIDATGKIIVGAGERLPEKKYLQSATKTFLKSLQHHLAEPVITRGGSGEGVSAGIFQVASSFKPLAGAGRFQGEEGGNHRVKSKVGHHPLYGRFKREIERLGKMKLVLIVQLNSTKLSSPVRVQVTQMVILLVVFIMVAVGGFLSLMTLRGLKGSRLSLGRISAFTDILVSSLPVGLIATGNDGMIMVYNSFASEILGLDEKKVIGTNPADSLPVELSGMLIDLAKIGAAEHFENVRSKNSTVGTKFLQLSSMSVADHDGGFAGQMLLVRDLTEIRFLEKELQRSERLAALGKMAAGVAHELRNPLSSIKGLAVILKSKVGGEAEGVETANILVQEVDRLNRGIGELLDYAKPGKLNKVQLNINLVVEKTISLIEVDLQSLGLSCDLQLSGELPEIKVDEDKINQVFLNLFLNAVQAMDKGGTLTIITRHENGHIVVIVEDTGTGIEPENLSKVFDPYFTTKGDGTGLGLAMSAKIVEEHDGKIEISSNRGRGTRVAVILPVG